MNPLNIILTILLFLSGVLTVILVLMHSGKGTGVSDMIASSLYNAGTGSGILEKNLDRLTVITATVFIVCVIVMALAYVYYRFRGLSIVQGILAGLRPAVIAMIASAGISLLILALYGQRTLPADLGSLDFIAFIIFLGAFFVLRKWKPSPIKVMAGAALAGVILYSFV